MSEIGINDNNYFAPSLPWYFSLGAGKIISNFIRWLRKRWCAIIVANFTLTKSLFGEFLEHVFVIVFEGALWVHHINLAWCSIFPSRPYDVAHSTISTDDLLCIGSTHVLLGRCGTTNKNQKKPIGSKDLWSNPKARVSLDRTGPKTVQGQGTFLRIFRVGSGRVREFFFFHVGPGRGIFFRVGTGRSIFFIDFLPGFQGKTCLSFPNWGSRMVVILG